MSGISFTYESCEGARHPFSPPPSLPPRFHWIRYASSLGGEQGGPGCDSILQRDSTLSSTEMSDLEGAGGAECEPLGHVLGRRGDIPHPPSCGRTLDPGPRRRADSDAASAPPKMVYGFATHSATLNRSQGQGLGMQVYQEETARPAGCRISEIRPGSPAVRGAPEPRARPPFHPCGCADGRRCRRPPRSACMMW